MPAAGRGRAGRILAACLAALSAGAAAPRDEAAAAGAWSLVLVGANRACTLTLAPEAGPTGLRPVRYPSGCRRALPIVSAITGWDVTQGSIRLIGGDGAALLVFSARADGALVARAASGHEFALTGHAGNPDADAGARPPPASVMLPQALPPPGTVGTAPIDPALSQAVGGLLGTYALDRFVEKDTCRVSLSLGGPASDRREVRLAEGCRDGGMAMFDPVSWRYENGRLVLMARRGHEVGLVPIPGRRWRRDPETGTTLILRRVDP